MKIPNGTSYERNLLHQKCYIFCLYLTILSVITSLVIAATIGGIIGETTLGYAKTVIKRYAMADSWMPMNVALDTIRQKPHANLYDEVFFKKQIKFQYPTSALLILDLPQKLFNVQISRVHWPILNTICWLSLFGIAATFFYLLENSIIENSANATTLNRTVGTYKWYLFFTVSISLAMIVLFYPLSRSYILGQIQTPMTLLAGLALLAWQKKRFGLAGILLGLCCVFKPQWLVIMIWALFRQQWRMLLFFFIIITIIELVSIATYGMNNFLSYLKVLTFISKHGESFWANQSINGLLQRILFNGNNLYFSNQFPPYNPIVYTLTLFSSFLILTFAIFWKVEKNPSSVDLAIVMLSLTMASPVAWEHHYGILLLIFAMILPIVINRKMLGNYTLIYLGVAFLLVSQKLDVLTKMFAHTYWNFLQSHLYFGALIFLFLLYKISKYQHRIEIINSKSLI